VTLLNIEIENSKNERTKLAALPNMHSTTTILQSQQDENQIKNVPELNRREVGQLIFVTLPKYLTLEETRLATDELHKQHKQDLHLKERQQHEHFV
jgi:hypothetical protein